MDEDAVTDEEDENPAARKPFPERVLPIPPFW